MNEKEDLAQLSALSHNVRPVEVTILTGVAFVRYSVYVAEPEL